jgi:predicted HD phosphohydrolase
MLGPRAVPQRLARFAAPRLARRLSTAVAEPAELQRLTAADVAPEVEAVVDASTRRVFDLFERFGDSDYIGEPMSITEHSVQTANAASKAGENDMAVLACLLHDVGHLLGMESGNELGMDGCGTPEHERIGADFLGAIGFPEDVAYLCHHHVDAKRYLCATQPGYHEKLSEASKITLRHQGGPMSAEEVAAAEADSRWPMVLRMRTYDEAGKDPTAARTSPRDFEQLIRSAVRGCVAEGGAKAYPLSPFAAGRRPRLNTASPCAGQASQAANAHAEAFPGRCVLPRRYHLSEEQLRFWDEQGYLILRGALPPSHAARLSHMCDEAAGLPRGDGYPWLVHHERSTVDGQVRPPQPQCQWPRRRTRMSSPVQHLTRGPAAGAHLSRRELRVPSQLVGRGGARNGAGPRQPGAISPRSPVS